MLILSSGNQYDCFSRKLCGGSGLLLHSIFLVIEICVALLVAQFLQAPIDCNNVQEMLWPDVDYAEQALTSVVGPIFSLPDANQTGLEGFTQRRLVANDFTADFSRRLAFHRWIEQDVVLDRVGFEQYLQRSLQASGLGSSARRKAARPQNAPKPLSKLQQDLRAAGFQFNPAYFSLEHRMLPGAPWSRGRDQYMMLVRYGLRPNHYFFSAGCGPFSLSGHVVRYLLAGRYYCIEGDEYLLRAAVEYEVPEAGLIHKRPNFLLHHEPDVGVLGNRMEEKPPSHFDFAMIQQELTEEQMEAAVTGIARYLRPRSGRLVLLEPLPSHLQRRLGLQRLESMLNTASQSMRDACPLSVSCDLFLYHT